MHNDQNQVIEAGSQIYQHDANFNTTAVIDTTGAVQERYLYDPYGSPTYKTSTWGTRSSSSYDWLYMHQGGRYDVVGNLYHFRNRDHSPTLGRWMQNDPLGYVDGMNRYEYEMSGPVDGLDPSGLASIFQFGPTATKKADDAPKDPPPTPSFEEVIEEILEKIKGALGESTEGPSTQPSVKDLDDDGLPIDIDNLPEVPGPVGSPDDIGKPNPVGRPGPTGSPAPVGRPGSPAVPLIPNSSFESESPFGPGTVYWGIGGSVSWLSPLGRPTIQIR